MTDATKLFRSGKRYRGFAPAGNRYVPVGLTVYPVDSKEVRLRHIFPSRVGESIKEGDVLYLFLEEERLVAEIRILKREERGMLASLDFVTEDRRKLPRVSVEDLLDIEANIICGGREYTGRVVDLSLSAVSVRAGVSLPSQECEISIKYRSTVARLKGRIVRSEENLTVLEIVNGNSEMVELLQRVYADLFLKVQRLT